MTQTAQAELESRWRREQLEMARIQKLAQIRMRQTVTQEKLADHVRCEQHHEQIKQRCVGARVRQHTEKIPEQLKRTVPVGHVDE